VRSFLRAKRLNAKEIHKEIFTVYGGKCLSRTAVLNFVKKFSEGPSKVVHCTRPGCPVEIATEETAAGGRVYSS
jgi:hypothetical protein